MHRWGDKDVDWDGISDAAAWISTQLLRWGRVHVRDFKEKYGTVRVYCDFGWRSLLNVTHPRYSHYRPYPRWLMWVDIRLYMSWPWRLLNRVVVPYHRWLYRRTYAAAIRRWPHLREEILCCADWRGLLVGLK